MKKLLLILTLLVSVFSFGQTVSYTTMTSITCPAEPVATISPTVAGLTFSQISRGSGVTCAAAGGSISGSGFENSLAANISDSKWYTYNVTSDTSASFTVSSLDIVSKVSDATGSPNVSVQYSINGGARTDIGFYSPTTSAVTYTITPSSAISVGANQTLNIFIIPNSLTASTTTCSVENASSITLTTVAVGKTSNCALCDWYDPNTWLPVGVPDESEIVTIRSTDIVYNTNITSPGLLRKAATNVYGGFQIEQDTNVDSATSGAIDFTYGSTGTLLFNNNSGSYGVSHTAKYWPNIAGPFNVSVINSGGITMITARTVEGTFQIAGPLTNSYNITIGTNGTLQLNAGYSFLGVGSPTYGSASLLKYNSGGSPTRSDEWTTATFGLGYPANVQVSNGTTLNMDSSFAQCSGNVTIDLSSRLNSTTGKLTVLGNVTNNGTLFFGDDITVEGNWTQGASASQLNNGKAVFFTAPFVDQTITKTGGGDVYFDYLIVNKAADNVKLSSLPATNIIFNTATILGRILEFKNAGQLDLNGQTLTFNNDNGDISVDAAGRTITSGILGAKLIINGDKWVTGAGTLTIGANVTTELNKGLDFGSNKTTINGILQINGGGFAKNNSPIYADTSTLVYNNVSNYDVGYEWTGNATTAGLGTPQDVTIASGTVNMPQNTTRSLAGNFLQTAGFFNLTDATNTNTLNIEGNATINGGIFDINKASGGTGIVNLKGDLTVGSSAQLLANNGTATFNFNGIGDGLGAATTQTIDVASTTTAERISFNINSGAYTKLINQDFAIGTSGSFIVKTGGTLDFGFNGTTALNLIKTGGVSHSFGAQSGSILKVTSPDGLTSYGNYTGNVQIGATTLNRIFDPGAIYHYIGKASQVSGNGLPNGITGKVIVELDTDALTFNASGNKTINTAGTLEIKKGIVVDTSSDSFGDASSNAGNLTMSGGRYRIFKGSTQPDLSGTYNLTAGVVEYAGTLAKTVRSPKTYQNIEVTGNNVGNSSGNITLNALGTFTVKNGGVFTINANGITGPTGTQTVTVENNGLFKTGEPNGFNGGSDTSVRSDIETITLEAGSTVEYKGADQVITPVAFPFYKNLTISGTGIKTLLSDTETRADEDLNIVSGTLKIGSTKTLTVKQAVKITPTVGIFEIENNGQLIQIDETDANTGTGTNFTVNRITKVRNWDFVYWSSPVEGFDISGLPDNNRYSWVPTTPNANGTQGNWAAASGNMAKGQGYIARIANGATASDSPIDTPVTFAGAKPNNGQIPANISRGTILGSTDDCWNLLGNPYPSAIDADAFLSFPTNNNIEGSVRVWKHGLAPTSSVSPFYQNFTYNYSQNDYLVYNKVGSSLGPNTFGGKIASGQGFFVRMLDEEDGKPISPTIVTTAVVFNNAFRRDAGAILDNTEFYRNSNTATATTTVEKNRIWLDLIAPNSQVTRTLVGYITDATLAKDRLYDALIEVDAFGFYSLINTQKQIIQGRPVPFDSNDQVPMGVFIDVAGNYTIAVSAADGLFADVSQNIYLEDKLTNVIHDLRVAPYVFASAVGEFNNRFVLRYTNTALNNEQFEIANNLIIYTNDKVNIKANEQIKSIVVFDLLGRKIYEKNNINATEVTLDKLISEKQALIVKTIFVEGQVVSKKIIF